MTDFRDARYIFTQDGNDERGIAWTQYVVSGLFARPGFAVNTQPANYDTHKVIDNDRTIDDLFVLKTSTLGTPFEISPVFVDFITRTAHYHQVLQARNLGENRFAKEFYNRFVNASDNIRKIYAEFFGLVVIGAGAVSLADPNVNDANLNQYKLVVKPQFIASIPNLYAPVAAAVGQPANYLQIIYRNAAAAVPILNNAAAIEQHYNANVKVVPGIPTVFPNLYSTKYYGNKWRNLGNPAPGFSNLGQDNYQPDNDIYYDSLITVNKWFRNDKGQYYKVNDLTDQPELVPEPVQNDNCYGLNLDATNCSKFLDILFGTDDFSKQAFQDLFNDEAQKNFWPDIQKEINDIHPKAALLILQKFGFKINPLNGQVRSVAHWLEHNVKQYFGQNDDQLTSVIRKNEKLLRFLELLVHFVNYNPGILNPNFANVSDNVNDFIKNNMTAYANAMKLKPARTCSGSLDRIFEYRRRNRFNYPRRILNRQRFMPMFGAVKGFNVGVPADMIFNGGSQRGGCGNDMNSVQVGGVRFNYQLQPFTTSRRDVHGHGYLRNLFEQLKSELARRNKTLNEKDIINIKNQIRNLEIYEKRLYRTLATMENYIGNTSYSYGNNEKVKLSDMELYANELNLNGMKYQTQEEKIMNTLDMLLKHFKSDDKFSGNQDRDIQSSDYGYSPVA